MNFEKNVLYIIETKKYYPEKKVYTGYAFMTWIFDARLWFYLEYNKNRVIYIIKDNENSQLSKVVHCSSEDARKVLEYMTPLFAMLKLQNEFFITEVDLASDAVEYVEDVSIDIVKVLLVVLIFFFIGYIVYKKGIIKW